MTDEQWKLKDRHTLGMIQLTLSENVASGLLKALSNIYEKPFAMNNRIFDA